MASLPRVLLLATGGTIAGIAPSAAEPAGYTAGMVGADALLAAVPQLSALARLRAEQLFNLDSSDLGPAHWLALARRVCAARSRVRVWQVVTVACRPRRSCPSGFPTMRERPTTTASAPFRSMP